MFSHRLLTFPTMESQTECLIKSIAVPLNPPPRPPPFCAYDVWDVTRFLREAWSCRIQLTRTELLGCLAESSMSHLANVCIDDSSLNQLSIQLCSNRNRHFWSQSCANCKSKYQSSAKEFFYWVHIQQECCEKMELLTMEHLDLDFVRTNFWQLLGP